MGVACGRYGYGWAIINMDNEKCITIYYDGNDFDKTIDRELERLGLTHGQVAIIALPK